MNKKKVKASLDGRSSMEVFQRLRGMIAEALQADGIEVKPVGSNLELAISTFCPSFVTKHFVVSDFPFVASRYLSVEDGHLYTVFDATDDGQSVVALRRSVWSALGSWVFRLRVRGMAVALTDEAWIRSKMIMYSINSVGMEFDERGSLGQVNGEISVRRAYPLKLSRAYFSFVRARLARLVSRSGEAEK